MAIKRRLTENEIGVLKSIYGDEIDYSKVKIRKGNTFIFKQGTAFVINNKIHFHEDDYKEDFAKDNNISDMAWLAHEVCHIWQFQNLDYDWGDALEEHILYGKKVYDYVPDASKCFTDYRFEQQGSIIQDYYFGRFFPSTPVQEMLERIIYSVIQKPGSSIDTPVFNSTEELITHLTGQGKAKTLELAEESLRRITRMT